MMGELASECVCVRIRNKEIKKLKGLAGTEVALLPKNSERINRENSQLSS